MPCDSMIVLRDRDGQEQIQIVLSVISSLTMFHEHFEQVTLNRKTKKGSTKCRALC